MHANQSNRQFVCHDKFEATVEQNHDKNTKRDRKLVRFDLRFDCDSDAPTPHGGREEERELKTRSGVKMGQKTQKDARRTRTSWRLC